MSLFIIKRIRRSCRGQALLETLFLMLISVVIILGAFSRFYTLMDTYIQGYFGNYIACLLETGELPLSAKECQDALLDFQAEAEKAIDESSNASSKKEALDTSSSLSHAPPSKTSFSTSPSQGSESFGSRRSFLDKRPKRQPSRRTQKDSESDSDSSDGYLSFQAKDGANSSYGRSRGYEDLDFLESSSELYDVEDENITYNQSGLASRTTQSSTSPLAPLRQDLTPAPPSTSEEDSSWSLFNISKILKWILIVGVIVVLLIFLVGQAQQISKSL